MLCDACQHRQSCLPAHLANHDPQIRELLQRLKHCEKRQIVLPLSKPQGLKAIAHQLFQHLRGRWKATGTEWKQTTK